jgi:hypothetical protein
MSQTSQVMSPQPSQYAEQLQSHWKRLNFDQYDQCEKMHQQPLPRDAAAAPQLPNEASSPMQDMLSIPSVARSSPMLLFHPMDLGVSP